MTELQLIKPGTIVHLEQGDREATILTVAVYPAYRIMYLVCWWEGGSRNEAWIEEFEVSPEESKKFTIGFK